MWFYRVMILSIYSWLYVDWVQLSRAHRSADLGIAKHLSSLLTEIWKEFWETLFSRNNSSSLFRESRLEPAIALKGAFLTAPWLYDPLCSGTSGLAIIFRRLVFWRSWADSIANQAYYKFASSFCSSYFQKAKTKTNKNTASEIRITCTLLRRI